MNKNQITSIVLIAALAAMFGWAQVKIKNERAGKRIEEKILMLSDRPKVTKTLALGFDGALANMMWIRAIQYFGGNFSSLNQADKRQGLINLLNNMLALDPNFIGAYQFAGFVINEAVKDPELAIDFLLQGAQANPDSWRLPFEAGFIAFYQLKEYELAKDLFIQSAYGRPFQNLELVEIAGIEAQDSPTNLIDGAIDTEVAFIPAQGRAVIDLGKVKTVGRITLKQNVYRDDSFRTAYATDLESGYEVLSSVTQTNFHNLNPPIEARYFRFDHFQSAEAGGPVLIADIQFYDPRHEEVPSYVDRMAIEMDRSSGRFSAAWSQYLRYFQEAQKTGDQTSANLAFDKLNSIYNQKARELLTEAVNRYREETGELPSMNMTELIEGGYIQRVIDHHIQEDPNFANEVMPVIFPNGRPSDILTAMDGQTPYYLITYETEAGVTDWYLASYSELKDQQENLIQRLQQSVNKFEMEEGRLPNSLEELNTQEWFTQSETIFEDPLQGEFYLDNNGTVRARGGLNPPTP